MRRPRLKSALFFALTAASTAVVWMPIPVTAAPAEGLLEGGSSDGGAIKPEKPEGGTPISKTPPDPPPMNERMQWVFDLRWDRGEVFLVAVHKQDMGTPHPTPRAMGRFALELFEGPTLIERVRFDFPMLGVVESTDAGLQTPPRFEPKLRTRIGVFFPATKRGTKLELWDRARDVRWQLPWPPREGAVTPDASVD